MITNRLTLITLAVDDLARARAYYEKLGWKPSDETDDISFYDLEGQKFALYSRAKLEEDLGRDVPKNTGAITLAQNFASEAEVDEWHGRALAAGAHEISKPEKVFWGGYSGYHEDPEGHLWEFAYNPFWELDEKGMII